MIEVIYIAASLACSFFAIRTAWILLATIKLSDWNIVLEGFVEAVILVAIIYALVWIIWHFFPRQFFIDNVSDQCVMILGIICYSVAIGLNIRICKGIEDDK